MNIRLSRQYSIVSLTCIIVIAVILGLLYRYIAISQLTQQISNANIHLAEIIANTIFPDTRELLYKNQGPSSRWLTFDINRSNKLDDGIKRLSAHQTITKIKLFNPDGYVVFSSLKNEIGTEIDKHDQFLSAKKGTPATEMKFKRQLTSLDGKTILLNRDLVSSYIPVWNTEGDMVIGVFEMYSDATNEINNIQKTEYIVHGAISLLLFLLYLFLYFYVRKADKVLVENEKTQETTQQEKLFYLSNFDEMTELPNRNSFISDLDGLITKHADGSKFFSVLVSNIDRMDQLNNYGTGFGNKIIIQTASYLKASLRGEDKLYRIDGNIFGIILQGVSDAEQAEVIANRIHEYFIEPVMIDNREAQVSLSMGISSFPNDTQSKDDLFAYATSAMHRARAIGGNNYMFYSSDIIQETMQRYELEIDLRQALTKGQFEVYYQPKIDIQQSKVIGAEALIRWNHPEKGIISPDVFISLLESTGQIIAVGQWVMEQACIQCKRWHDLGYKDMSIAVNISAKQFNTDLLMHVIQAISFSGLPTECVELEITESILAKNAGKAIEMLASIKESGIQVSIDDFGTGYSSLSYLATFPVDHLKVDKSFIDDITTNKRNASITETIIAMSRALEMGVIIEGVETEEQLEYVHRMQCTVVQGFLFSPPVPADKFIELLAADNIKVQNTG